MGDRAAKNALFDQFARVGKALGSGKRLELLDLLAQGERTVDALARASELGLTTASAHLQTLKAANLVTTRRDGTKVYLPAGRHRRRPTAGVGAGGGQRPSARRRSRRQRLPGPRHRTSHPGPSYSNGSRPDRSR